MKRLVTAAVLAAFGLIPLTAAACGEYDEAMATSTPPAQLASPPPAASKAPVATTKTPLLKVTKTVAKRTAPASEAKVAAATAN